MFRQIFKIISRLLLSLITLGTLLLFIPRLITSLNAIQRIYSVQNAPIRRAAIVFGAGLWRDGTPSPVLRDRVATAAELYFTGKVEKILMSGDNRFVDYNEPGAMHAYAVQLGVPEEDIVLDYAGRRTYDTCYRAKAIFGLHAAILITQNFLPRASIPAAIGDECGGVSPTAAFINAGLSSIEPGHWLPPARRSPHSRPLLSSANQYLP
jgi:vancomycin permeability regulator SanA